MKTFFSVLTTTIVSLSLTAQAKEAKSQMTNVEDRIALVLEKDPPLESNSSGNLRDEVRQLKTHCVKTFRDTPEPASMKPKTIKTAKIKPTKKRTLVAKTKSKGRTIASVGGLPTELPKKKFH